MILATIYPVIAKFYSAIAKNEPRKKSKIYRGQPGHGKGFMGWGVAFLSGVC